MSKRNTRRTYSKEFKQETVRLVVEAGHHIPDVARDLDIEHSVIRRWVREYRKNSTDAFPGHGKLLPADEEIRQLKRELQRVKMERDILKKAISIFSGPEK